VSDNINFRLEGYAASLPGVGQGSRWSKRASAEETSRERLQRLRWTAALQVNNGQGSFDPALEGASPSAISSAA